MSGIALALDEKERNLMVEGGAESSEYLKYMQVSKLVNASNHLL